MDLATTYLGLALAHPLVPGASPLADDLDGVRRLEDAGAAAIVLRSLFEEQIVGEQWAAAEAFDPHSHAHPEAQSYLPERHDFALGPDQYLEHLRRTKAAVAVPVIASLNGTTPGGWLDYGRLMQEAGADALELNLFELAADPAETGAAIEERLLATVRTLKAGLRIPLAVKLGPFHTALAHFARALDDIGVDGLVLFNRFYQPDIDIEALEHVAALHLSDSSELPLRLRWIALLSGRVRAALAVTGGVHEPIDAVKAIMCGATVVQVVSTLLRNGPEQLGHLHAGLERWLEQREYGSLAELRGSMSLGRCPDPKVLTRANYMRVLHSWRPGLEV